MVSCAGKKSNCVESGILDSLFAELKLKLKPSSFFLAYFSVLILEPIFQIFTFWAFVLVWGFALSYQVIIILNGGGAFGKRL